MRKYFILIIFFLLGTIVNENVNAQITVTVNHSATSMAQMLAGPGVSVSNAVYTCDSSIQAGKFFVTSSTLGMDSGIILTSGSALNAVGPSATPSTALTFGGDVDLAVLTAPNASQDRCILDFDFVPIGDTISFLYVFGSSEYQTFTCSSFTDAFGFFISGPGITGTFTNAAKDVALLPSGCYINVNTVNGSTSNPCGSVTSPCAPPNNALFRSNLPIGNTLTGVAYNGFTDTMRAISAVIPCSTYHLKLAVCDASDHILDSGVFLGAGSLSSNATSFSPLTLLSNPEPYIVEGCAAGGIRISIPIPLSNPKTIHFTIGGTATNGVDYQLIPDSIVIPAGSVNQVVPIIAFQDGLNEGKESVILYKTSLCSNIITDSAIVWIYDSLQMKILTNDTAICLHDTLKINTQADTMLHLQWSHIPYISNDTVKNPRVSPPVTSWYVLTGNLASSGCPPVKDSIKVTINATPNINIGPDIVICKGMTHLFNPIITPVQPYTYSWSPPAFLSSGNVVNPLGTFINTGTFTYILQVNPIAIGCSGWDTVQVTVLPDDFTLINHDTVICQGTSVPLDVIGDTHYHYQWTPPTYLNFDTLQHVISTPDTTTLYTITASYPTCPNIVKTVNIRVEPVPVVNIGPDRQMCLYDTIKLEASVTPEWFTNYTYSWTPNTNLSNSNTKNVIFNGNTTTTYSLTATTPNGCADTDVIVLTVYLGDFLTHSLGDTIICPLDTVNISASGAVAYHWSPGLYVSDSTAPNPNFYPISTTTFTVIGTSINGCFDTLTTTIGIAPNAVLDLGQDITLFPGDTHQFSASGNCSYFTWFPSTYLNATNLQDPVISNATSSQMYTVLGTTQFGCKTTDTINVTISNANILALPNAFTPGGGTSINDNLRLDKLGLISLNGFKIYNRWGEMVYSSTNLNEGWNGMYKDKPQPMGTYVYTIDAIDGTGKRINKTGNITLLR